jgi:hypothetical protein
VGLELHGGHGGTARRLDVVTTVSVSSPLPTGWAPSSLSSTPPKSRGLDPTDDVGGVLASRELEVIEAIGVGVYDGVGVTTDASWRVAETAFTAVVVDSTAESMRPSMWKARRRVRSGRIDAGFTPAHLEGSIPHPSQTIETKSNRGKGRLRRMAWEPSIREWRGQTIFVGVDDLAATECSQL